MHGRSGTGVVPVMTNRDDEIVQFAAEKFERRLAEECGSLRVGMATEFGKVRLEMADESGRLRAEMQQGFGSIRVEMHQGFGAIRLEMSDRNAELLKWLLVYGATQTAALVAVTALLR